MIAVTKPILCPVCKKPMGNYSIDRLDQMYVFRCECGNVQPLKFEAYEVLLKTGQLDNN